jgi:hypothetical protein
VIGIGSLAGAVVTVGVFDFFDGLEVEADELARRVPHRIIVRRGQYPVKGRALGKNRILVPLTGQ